VGDLSNMVCSNFCRLGMDIINNINIINNILYTNFN
jgi:hypothetical protein